MYWKRMLLIALVISVAIFALFIAFHWNNPDWHFRSKTFIEDAAIAIALALGMAGNQELDRGEHRRVRRITRNILIVWFSISLLLFGITRLYKTTVFDFVLDYLMYVLWLLFAAIFPLALYLNRKQKKSSTESTVADAN